MVEMHKDRVEIKRLLGEYSNGTIDQSGFEALQAYLKEREADAELNAVLAELFEEMAIQPNLVIDSDSLYTAITRRPEFNKNAHKRNRRPLWWFAGAAAIALAVFKVLLPSVNTLESTPQTALLPVNTSPDAAPSGAHKAILKLADGTEIDLDAVENGVIATENSIRISLEGTSLHYDNEDALEEGAMLMNTITTTKGRQFQVVLPDGTNIWLNALSSLTYPVRFDAHSRQVEISGEAYFEVEKAADWPFIVKTATQEITVLGTHFNISAYHDDEVFRTTLVEGKLKVSTVRDSSLSSHRQTPTENSLLLSPGEQAVSYKGSDRLSKETVVTEEVMSWRNNLFVFDNEEISEVMKKVMRWYDIDIVYRDGMEDVRIGGTIPRFEKIEQLMNALEATGLLHYKRKGGQIVIMK